MKILKWLWVAIGHPIIIDSVLFNASLGPVTLNHFFPPELSSGKSDDTQRLSVASETKETAGVSPYIFWYIIYIHTFYMWAYVYNGL